MAFKPYYYRTASLLTVFILSCSGRESHQHINASGTIEAIEVNVASKISGQVEKLLVDEGSAVEQGDTLAIIDHSALDLQLRQAEAGVELADAQLRLLLDGPRVEDIRQAEERLKQAEINLKVARRDLERIKELFESGSVTQKQRDDAEARYMVALSKYNSAKQALQSLHLRTYRRRMRG